MTQNVVKYIETCILCALAEKYLSEDLRDKMLDEVDTHWSVLSITERDWFRDNVRGPFKDADGVIAANIMQWIILRDKELK